ncbi:EAL domain-containing protein [Sulfurirhabdus autotrophica]|uniref:Sensor protein FixL n=1 Tax=Sulfurirhabdus autotrophica TaxID=1706046 RepID=A0A4R3XYJ5_9PROT|nr:EAL domain-containing protein [Sulfurirhabdus autotrophica]TCV84137.1 PAS domain S-box-containing protein [Sulfurirhabdus autotrophica]
MSLINIEVPIRVLLKRFALIFIPISAALITMLFWGIQFDDQLQVEHREVREVNRIKVAEERIKRDLSRVETDLRIIINLPVLQGYFDGGTSKKWEELEKLFLVISRETRRYDQIRYLDINGQEVVRINYNAGKPSPVPPEQLQNKSGRYYFSDTIKLNKDEIFVSPLDLNMEDGSLDIPYKPMIRYGTPVFDSAGNKKGIILFNYFGDELLQSFRVAMQGANHGGMLLNRNGYWLAGTKREDEWGFMLGKNERTFGHDFPDAWRTISSSKRGSLLTDQGLFVYTTVHIRLGVQPSLRDSTLAHAADWKIVSFIRKDDLLSDSFYNQPFNKILMVFIYLILALGSFFIALVTLKREQAKQEILNLNQELEKRVTEHAEGEENLSVTLNSIGDAVMATDIKGQITRMNIIAEQLTGWSRAEAIGRPVADIFCIINQNTRQPATIPVEATLAQGVIHDLSNDTVLIARDSSERPIADSCAPIRNRDGKVTGAVLVFRDVTKEYASKVALRESAARIQTILNTVADGIITINERGIIETVNPAAERLFDYAAIEIIGQNVNILMPEPHHSQHDGYLEHYRTTGEARIIGIGREVEGRRKDGNTFPMYLAVNEMSLDGQRYFTGIVHDLTESKQAEELLHQAKEKAELANLSKDSFLATMSHEIRTPLTGMLGMLEVLSLTPLNRDQKETLHAAWDSSRGLLRIVSDILDWSKIEAGKLHLAPQSTSIPQLLQEVVNTYSRVASVKSLVLRQHVDARLSPTHIVDPLRLSQVLNNFVSNAIKFTHSGEIELCAELLNQLDSGERIRFSVKDTGIGIAKDAQQRLFRRYQQESVDTTRQYGGTGLGLAICQSLVNLMDGQIELTSEPGQGSVFSITLTLPVSGVPGERVQSTHPEVEQRQVKPLFEHGQNSPLVLAVDDHPINRDLLARQVKLLGLRAETAENGGEALLKWREGRFAMIITDCHMPEMDGYAFSRAVRKIEVDESLTRTPIIAWTANALPEEKEQCHAAGMDDLLVKPVNLAQLKQTLEKWLSITEMDSSQPKDSVHGTNNSGLIAEPIDFAVLEQVEPDSVAQIQILHDFQAHIRADQAKLLEMLEQGDLANVASTAHRMKGSGRMVGAKYLVNACTAIEEASRKGNMTDAKAGTMELDEVIRQFEIFLIDVEKTNGNQVNINELNFLVVEDDDFQRRMLVKMLDSLGAKSICDAENGMQGIQMISGENKKPVDIVVCDLNMPEMDGLEFLRNLGLENHHISIIIISALGSKLLTSAGNMAKMYGMKLLGMIEKPIMLGQLQSLLSKYERSENKWQSPIPDMSFTLEEVLQGIHAKQFEPYFQPKVDLNTASLVGAEVLARWKHPELGVISPYAFIPLLEQSGNIDGLTFLILEKAAAACRSFHDKDNTLSISVNLSLVSLADTSLADKITQAVLNTGLDPRYVILEITETAAMTDVAHALENLARLCMNGFGLSIDDYGTGYSSMQQLTRIPFSELKIDQSFVYDLSENEALRIVVESSINMAHKLKVKSVAEGVESQQDWDTLKSMGCDTAQGYFIAKPMDVRAFHHFIENYNCIAADLPSTPITD